MSQPKRIVRPPSQSFERRLAAILSADVAGYSRLMNADEVGTLHTLTACREVTDSLIQQHHGRIVSTAGDSILAEFASAVDAVQCAIEIQQVLKVKNADLPSEQKMEFRMGINVGDVMVEGEQIYGDGVNVAARLQALADVGGLFISGTVYDQIRNKLALHYEDLGEQEVKNIAEPVRVWRVRLNDAAATGEAGSPKSEVRSPESKKQRSPDEAKRNLGRTPLPGFRGARPERSRRAPSRLLLVFVLVLLLGGIVILLYPSLPPFIIHHSSFIVQEAQPPALPLPDKPSIVVLPFVNMSGDPGQEYFSDGITEVLTSNLSQISSLFIIARNSAFFYKGKGVKVQDISRELGVRYVLEGSVQKAGERVRIIAQLIDATTGGHLWSAQYDRPLTDIFALQDEIGRKIAVSLTLKLTDEDRGRLTREYTSNLDAYDSWLRGREYSNRFTKEANAQARQMYEKAIALDPQYALAYTWLGFTYYLEWVWQWSQDPQSLERAFALVQKALALDGSLPVAHVLLGYVSLWKNRQHELAIAEGERALVLDPNCAGCYQWLATVQNYIGRPEEGIKLVEKALRLDPRNQVNSLMLLGWSYELMERYEEAIATLKKAITLNPNFFVAHLTLISAYVHSGREEEARAEAAEVLRLNPKFSVGAWEQRAPFKDRVLLERGVTAWRKAGLK
jgi:adenylate cyclase